MRKTCSCICDLIKFTNLNENVVTTLPFEKVLLILSVS